MIWSVTNGSMLGRQKNVTFLVMWPSDKRTQAAMVSIAGIQGSPR